MAKKSKIARNKQRQIDRMQAGDQRRPHCLRLVTEQAGRHLG